MKPQRSHEPVFWALFGAGGMLGALVGPALVVSLGVIAPLSLLQGGDWLSHDTVREAMRSPLAAFGSAAVISLLFFHAAHRILHTLHDIGVQASASLKWLCYGSATAGSVLAMGLALVLLFGGH